jgi:anti-sigma factor RsiW
MKKTLDQIQDKDSILLMYLSDELSPADRQKVDEMLGADADLSARLQAMSELNRFFSKVMADLNESESTDVSQPSLRGPKRLLRQYALERRRPVTVEIVARTSPWMRYGFSVAAAVLVGCMIWWDVYPGAPAKPHAPQIIAEQPADTPKDDSATMALLVDTMESPVMDDGTSQVIAAVDSRADETDFASDAADAAQSQD